MFRNNRILLYYENHLWKSPANIICINIETWTLSKYPDKHVDRLAGGNVYPKFDLIRAEVTVRKET